MEKIIFTIALFILTYLPLSSDNIQIDKKIADDFFISENYEKAAKLYEVIASETENADIYYNLGNTYYRMNNLPKAILNYRRAYRIAPEDQDIVHNLQLCQSQLKDQFDIPQEMFFISWLNSLIKSRSAHNWGLIGMVSFILIFLSFGYYIYGQHLLRRKISFISSTIFCLLFIICQIFAYIQHKNASSIQEVIIIKPIQTYSSPSLTSQKVRKLNEGTTLVVKENFTKGWIQIEMPDKSEAWIQNSTDIEYV